MIAGMDPVSRQTRFGLPRSFKHATSWAAKAAELIGLIKQWLADCTEIAPTGAQAKQATLGKPGIGEF